MPRFAQQSLEPAPVYRTGSPVESAMIALDMPMTPLNTLWQGAQQGGLDSFGLGTAIKDFTIPRGNVDPGAQARNVRLGGGDFGPYGLVVNAYESARRMLGAPTTGAALTEDEWKNSEYYREGVQYDAAMTTDRAAALATYFDERAAREYFGQKNMWMYLPGQLLGAIPDPVNYVPIFGPGARAAATAKFGFVAGHTLIGMGEGAINTAIFGAVTTAMREKLGDDVSFEASINNIAFATLAGGLFGGGFALGGKAWGAIGSYREARALAQARSSMESIRNLKDVRDVVNDAVGSVVERGEVVLSSKSKAILDRLQTEAGDKQRAARALDTETAGVTGNKAGEVVISPSGTRVAVRPEVVDISTLKRAEGNLQVRNRSADNAASVAQIEDIAINLDPARLMPNIDASQGAPLVGADGIVDSGNGRTAAIARAYEAYPEKADAYRKALEDAGYKTEGIEKPVLIQRRLTDLSPEARAQFNADANSSTTARMSAVELAAADRNALTDSVLSVYADAPITAAENRAFVARFLANIAQNERGNLVDPSGALSADGVRRIENAMIAAAYGDVDATALRKFAEATDDNTRSIVGALSDVAGKWLGLRRAIGRGEVKPEFDMTVELVEALRRLSNWREQAAREGRPVGTVIKEGLAQTDMLSGAIPAETRVFLAMMYRDTTFTRPIGRDALAERLSDVVDAALDAGQPDMLGEAYAATRLGVLKHGYGDDLAADIFQVDGATPGLGELGGPRAEPESAGILAGDRGGAGSGGGDRPGADAASGAGEPAGEIAGRVADRFTEAGRPADEAKAVGSMVEAFYATAARRAGMAVDNLVELFPLPEVRAAEAMPKRALAQSEIDAFHATFDEFDEFDWSQLGRLTKENTSGSSVEEWATNLAKLGVWSHERDLSPETGAPISKHVRLTGEVREFGSLDDLEAAIVDAGGPEQLRKKLVDDGVGVVRVEDAEFGGSSYVALSPESITIRPDSDLLFQSKPARGAIELADTGSIISLLKDADPSTAIHESAHHFLKMFRSMSEMPNAPAEMASDWATVKEWWRGNADAVAADSRLDGVTAEDVAAVLDAGTTGDAAKDAAIDVGFHEQWARAFEQYAAEGVAPTQGLAAIFEQFKTWLRGVYNSLADLNVEVSPELREVFGRLLGKEPFKAETVPEAVGSVEALKASQPARSMDELYAVAGKHQQALDDVGRGLAGEGIEWKNPDIKKRETTEAKMARKGYRSTSELTDVVRGGFIVDTPAKAEAVVAALGKRWRILDEGWNVTAEAYFDRKILVQFDDGTIGEVQIWHPELLKAKSKGGGHALYEEARKLPEDSPRALELVRQMQDLYMSAVAKASEDWVPVLARLMDEMPGGKPASGKASVNASGESLTPESMISSQWDARSQASDPRGMNQPLEPEITAGRPSQLKNDVSMQGDLFPPPIDMQAPKPPPPPDGLDAAAARVGKGEDLKALAEQFGVDAKTGDYLEAVEVEAMRETGRISEEEAAELKAADEGFEQAEAYAEALRAAAACVMG